MSKERRKAEGMISGIKYRLARQNNDQMCEISSSSINASSVGYNDEPGSPNALLNPSVSLADLTSMVGREFAFELVIALPLAEINKTLTIGGPFEDLYIEVDFGGSPGFSGIFRVTKAEEVCIADALPTTRISFSLQRDYKPCRERPKQKEIGLAE
jgi:hypothetical protein